MDIVPPKKIFQEPILGARAKQESGTYDLPGFLYPSQTETGAMVSFFAGHPRPRKGYIYSEGVTAMSKVKRVTLALFYPFTAIRKGLKGFAEEYLHNYIRLVNILMQDYERVPFFYYQYYSEFSKAVWDFSFYFLRYLGISYEIALKTGRILASVFQNDDAYYFRVMDILSCSSQELMLENPRKETNRLLKIYIKREPHFANNNDAAGNRMVNIIKALSFLLWLPPIKRAFKFAIRNVNFKWFQYDDMDYYWCLNRSDFECLGISFEERKEIQINLMIKHAEKMNPGKEIQRVEDREKVYINVIN